MIFHFRNIKQWNICANFKYHLNNVGKIKNIYIFCFISWKTEVCWFSKLSQLLLIGGVKIGNDDAIIIVINIRLEINGDIIEGRRNTIRDRYNKSYHTPPVKPLPYKACNSLSQRQMSKVYNLITSLLLRQAAYIKINICWFPFSIYPLLSSSSQLDFFPRELIFRPLISQGYVNNKD